MCTPDEAAMQVRVPGGGGHFELMVMPCAPTFTSEKNLCRNGFNTVLLNVGMPVFLCREERGMGLLHKSCVCPYFSRSICKHLRASLNDATEPIFTSLL